jgi:hypothetical protein
MSTPDDTPNTKVGRLLDQYGLDGLGATLETHWTDDGRDRKSLRDLADMFNKTLLRTQIREHDVNIVGADVDAYYDLLHGDDVSAGRAAEARTELAQQGVDVDALTNDFVTYQAMRSYLKDVRGASYERPDDAEQVAKEKEQIERLLTRTETVSREKLDRLRNTDRINLGAFRLFVGVDVFCETCGSQYSIEELLDRGGCDC